MKYSLVKMQQLSGSEASIYSLHIEKEEQTLFDRFIRENKISFISELKDIVSRLNSIGKSLGAREQFFKTREGKPGDLVCALYDIPGGKLRLYCIRFGATLIILGGGGQKPKLVRALQEVPKLEMEQKLMVKLSNEILKRQRDKEIWFTNDFMDFEGDLDLDF